MPKEGEKHAHLIKVTTHQSLSMEQTCGHDPMQISVV
jgi:hypothetical protein